MPKPDSSASAVVVSGGKQYRVAPGDRVLVDHLAAEPGSQIKLGKLLLFADGDGVKLGKELEGLDVEARVVAHPRGPRIESIRYKSKKRVRVHRGGRAHLTALEIIAVGGVGLEKPEAEEVEEKPKRGRAKAAPKKKSSKAAEPKAEAVQADAVETEAVDEAAKEPVKKPARRRTKKEETE